MPASTSCCILSLILLLACTNSSEIQPVLSVFHHIEASPSFGRGSTVNHFSGIGYLVPQWRDVSKSDNIHSRDWVKQRCQCHPTRALSLSKRLCGSTATSGQRWTRPADEWALFSQHALLRKMKAAQAAGTLQLAFFNTHYTETTERSGWRRRVTFTAADCHTKS